MKSKKLTLQSSSVTFGAYAVVAFFAAAGVVLLVRSYANPIVATVEGEFIHSYVDYEDGREGDVYTIKDVAGTYNRVEAGSVLESGKKLPRTGSKVRLKGQWKEGKLDITNTVDSITVLENATTESPEIPQGGTAATSYRRLIYLLNLNGASGAQPVITQADMQRLHGLPTSPDKYWAETSYAQVDLKSTVLPVISINASGTCSDSQVYTWADQAKAAAQAQGLTITGYTHELFVLPVSNCGWSGLGNVNGPRSFIAYGYAGSRSDNEHNGTAAHEFGHNVGLRHASSYRCTNGSTPVQISSSCSASTYGDIFDVMGDSGDRNYMGRLLNSYHRVQLGYIPTSKVQTITTSGNYRLASVNVNPTSTTAPQSLRVARSSSESYDLEYRSNYSTTLDTFAVSDPVVNGISVRLVPSQLRASTSPLLLDSMPATTTFTDAPSVSTAFTDSTAKVSFKVVSRTTAEVVVAVTINGIAPTPPTPTPPPPTDTTLPTISLTAPASGSSVTVGTTVTMTANATDNVAVTKVEFYNGTTLLASDTSSPYSYAWNTTGQTAGSKSLTAKAYDAAGNTRTSATATLNLTSTSTAVPGDANGDGRVNALDLSILISHDGQNYPPADFNKDGTVGAADMAILLSRWTW